jgi:hypothetical protein
MHDPANAEAAAEARKMGGLRKRREGTISGAYDWESARALDGVQRMIDIAVSDALSLDSVPTRCRLLLYAATVALRVIVVGDMETRLRALEAAVHGSQGQRDALADQADDFALGEDELL